MPKALLTTALILLGSVAGFMAQKLGLSLPWLLGPLISAGTIAIALPQKLPDGYTFPNQLRLVFIAVIGMMIGAQVTPALFHNAPRFALSFAALVLFVGLCHSWNYAIFRRLGGYDRPTAFFAASPGGLFESLSMGEEAGGDPARLTLQQFLRIIMVVTILPIGLSIWLGRPLGSAAGMTLAASEVSWLDLPVVVMAGLGGALLGRLLCLPAKQLTGPMAIAAILSLTGVWQLDIPQWLVNIAQIVVGTALGMRFAGLSRGLILRGAGLALISVGGMLLLAGAFAALLLPFTGESFDVLLISFAPGGVTEMALVALSLQANPAFVTLHHIFRILLTVLGLVLFSKRMQSKF